jgi:hypothetical protein
MLTIQLADARFHVLLQALYLCSLPDTPLPLTYACNAECGGEPIRDGSTYACLPRTKVETVSAKDLPCKENDEMSVTAQRELFNGTNLVFGDVELDLVGLPASVTVGDSCKVRGQSGPADVPLTFNHSLELPYGEPPWTASNLPRPWLTYPIGT